MTGSPANAAIAARADLLHETADHHGTFEAVAPPHNWWDWYAAYMTARESGRTPDEAALVDFCRTSGGPGERCDGLMD